jgi:fructoselysine-6-P-deglycase FrlB-like protein
MIHSLYIADLQAKPAALRGLAERLDALVWPVAPGQRVLLTGMGSSWFAADTAARRLRRAGVHAVADIASIDATFPPSADLAVVGISASGTSHETLALLEAHHGTSSTIALTNTPGLSIPADHTVLMHAGAEPGGVACRSYVHTLVALLQLERQLTGGPVQLAEAVVRAADAVEHLLADDDWLAAAGDVLDGPDGTWVIGPAERYGNALQGALMLREGPRRVADGCETGDWSHVDVYLTKSVDYRALLFPGSRHDDAAARWMRDRERRFVVFGRPSEATTGAEVVVRYPHDDDPLVALLVEVVAPELLSARWWSAD